MPVSWRGGVRNWLGWREGGVNSSGNPSFTRRSGTAAQDTDISAKDSIADIVAKVAFADASAVEETAQQLDHDNLAASAKAIGSARDFKAQAQTSERAEAWEKIQTSLEQTAGSSRQGRADTEALFAAIRAGDSRAVAAAQTALVQRRGEFSRGVQTAETVLDEAILVGQRRIDDVYNTSRISIIAALVAACAVAGVVTWTIRRSIVGPLDLFVAFVEQVGGGDRRCPHGEGCAGDRRPR